MEIFWTVDTNHGYDAQTASATHILILINNITTVSALVFTVRKKESMLIVSYFISNI